MKILIEHYNILKKLILCTAIYCSIAGSICFSSYAGDIDESQQKKSYRRGKTTLEIRVFPDKSGLAVKHFNHPYYLKKEEVIDILSSIYYIDKDFMKKIINKKKNKAKRVFQGDEIAKLTPLIIDAFSKAGPGEDLLISSISERFLLEGLENVFSLFITGDKMNVMFAAIKHRGEVSKSQVINVRKLSNPPEPTRTTSSRFWELAAKPGQQFMPDRKNALIIDFKSLLFVQGVEKIKQEAVTKYTKNFKPIVDPLEDRIKKLEEMLNNSNQNNAASVAVEKPAQPNNYESYQNNSDQDNSDKGNLDQDNSDKNDFYFDNRNNRSTTNTDEIPNYTNRQPMYNNEGYNNTSAPPKQTIKKSTNTQELFAIIDKFYALRELVEEELITYNDYDLKKAELLKEFQKYEVKVSLKELKKLHEMGFITKDEFDREKAELLKNM